MISTQTYILLELVFVFGGLLAFLVWQMNSLKRARMAREARERAQQDARSDSAPEQTG